MKVADVGVCASRPGRRDASLPSLRGLPTSLPTVSAQCGCWKDGFLKNDRLVIKLLKVGYSEGGQYDFEFALGSQVLFS